MDIEEVLIKEEAKIKDEVVEESVNWEAKKGLSEEDMAELKIKDEQDARRQTQSPEDFIFPMGSLCSLIIEFPGDEPHQKVYECSLCHYQCSYKSSSKRHLLTHTNIKLFKCTQCDYACKVKYRLNEHMLTHCNTKLLKCSQCQYECNYKNSMNNHMLTHSDIKLFKCPLCCYECNKQYHLNEHLIIHSDIKLFGCPQCHYKCNRKGNLKKHMLLHSEICIKPLKRRKTKI